MMPNGAMKVDINEHILTPEIFPNIIGCFIYSKGIVLVFNFNLFRRPIPG